jgi:hypothetical protein
MLFGGPLARADGVCENPHNVTAAERAVMTEVLETARGALPPPPPEWVIVGDDTINVPASFCLDPPVAMTYSFGRSYGNRSQQKQQASEQATAAAAATAQADLAKKQPRLDALMARMNALSQQAVAASQAGDQARIEKINRELESVSSAYTSLLSQGDAAAQIEAAGAESLRDIEIHFAVRVNPVHAVAPATAKPVAVPAGARAALSWNTEKEGVTTGHALLLVGPWKQNPSGKGWSPAVAAGKRDVKAGWYAVEVDADPSRIASSLRDIDAAALAATLKP